MAEVTIKGLKSKIFKYFSLHKTKRYLELLPQLVKIHNNTPHSSHQFAPAAVNKKNEGEVFSNLYKRLVKAKPQKPVFNLNDKVRLSGKRIAFKKHYLPNYSDQIFKIAKIKPTLPVPTYKLMTEDGRILDSSYTKEEISRAG